MVRLQLNYVVVEKLRDGKGQTLRIKEEKASLSDICEKMRGSDSGAECTNFEESEDESENYNTAAGILYYENKRIKWTKFPSDRGRNPQQNIIMRLPGLKGSARQVPQPSSYKFWDKLFTEEMQAEIVLHTRDRIRK